MDVEIKSIFKEINAKIIETLGSIRPDEEQIYACGFWLFYCDYSVLGTPCFAYSTTPIDDDIRWAPPNWIIDVEDKMMDALSPIYDRISNIMSDKDDDNWEELIRFQYESYTGICLSINNKFKRGVSPFEGWDTTDDFIIGVFEEREGEEVYNSLAELSVGKKRAKELGIL